MYITGKEAQLLLDITTRQGLIKIVKEHNITTKPQGAGKPNLYLRDDIIKAKESRRKTAKHKPKKTIKKVQKQKEIIEDKKQESENNRKKITEYQDSKDLNPLSEIGKMIYDSVIEELRENGTFEKVDLSLVQAFASCYQNWLISTKISSEKSNSTTDNYGNEKISPHFLIAEKSLNQVLKIGAMLGIGVRSRIGIDTKKQKDKKTLYDLIESNEEWLN